MLYNFFSVSCSKIKEVFAILKLMIIKPQYPSWLMAQEKISTMEGAMMNNMWDSMDSLLVFHVAFLSPSEARLVCCPSAAAKCKKVSRLVEVIFCTLTLLLCSSGLILCQSNFLIIRCLQENMLWFIKCSIQHYFFETNSHNDFLFANLSWIRKKCIVLL